MKAQAVISRAAIGMLPLPREQLWLYLSKTAERRAGIYVPPRFHAPPWSFHGRSPRFRLKNPSCMLKQKLRSFAGFLSLFVCTRRGIFGKILDRKNAVQGASLQKRVNTEVHRNGVCAQDCDQRRCCKDGGPQGDLY